MHLENGALVVLDSTFAGSASLTPRLTVIGANGVCQIIGDTRVIVYRPDGSREDVTPDTPGPERDRHDDPMRRFAEVVRDVVTSGEVPPGVPTFADGLACDVVLDQLRGAHSQGGPRAKTETN